MKFRAVLKWVFVIGLLINGERALAVCIADDLSEQLEEACAQISTDSNFAVPGESESEIYQSCLNTGSSLYAQSNVAVGCGGPPGSPPVAPPPPPPPPPGPIMY